ncbi:M16 family metallopeptidase [Sphingomonas endolithica]|uniref:M16 family metallopeptidase n=1 Tax=Sphingomonas endolithica TaxID=2972485 RepID=UPI0021AFCFFF|nr:insulinase family protein [Sphingomonas sp. ZFBP2030]
MKKYARVSARLMSIPLFVLSLSGLPAEKVVASDGITSDPAKPTLSGNDWGRLVTGSLKNGVRFAILSRRGNEPGVGLLMRNEGGFIAERRPGERGLAHLIEHVVFHSPTVGSPEDLDHLKRVGMPLTFPAPNAGSTSWRETNYYLSTRTTALGDLDALLSLFREAAAGMTLRTDAVDTSRGEVTREMADKKFGNDIYANYIGAIAPGSPNDMIDAQNSDDVPSAGIDTVRALYERLYRPENMMIVVVGNVKVDEVKALIEKRFGDWKRTRTTSHRAPTPMFQRDRIRPISFSALAQGRRTALLTVVMPTRISSSSRAQQAQAELMDLLVTRVINDRLAALQPTPPGKVGMFIENGEQGHRQIMLWDNFNADLWAPAVARLRQTTCELARAGFTTGEWAMAKRNLIADLEHRAAEMPRAANVDLAKDLSHALADGRHLIPSDELLRYARIRLPRMDTRSGSKWWSRQWGSGVEHLRVEGPELAKVADPVSAIRQAANGASGASPCRMASPALSDQMRRS